ncbi:NAD-dependent epimerase/dehydratase family protein [Mycolicibacter hiberniae]|uniref:UDP-glucose 4-epimerase n=1 Tax=Mycolicibacter hiberniae TaxID=29314 RepID=A0A7I7WY98_9MYCO|nr:NAD-dependent epimerase/dehydratase family protein [Mycolicibacter hiberniae]MCV7086509.1 SDR family NAD(P)-dependent oxidoreductase [Mycolicibacter hiberniae]ORV69983.1 nucleoside-diphosphate sugar epimerase [Mycolicibacter hiberniae]BBZ22082.1 UDP-glucose 4-epimerase [Mycolicibacter hiberniae]
MKAFVTGGAGFIGSSLVDRLLQRGDDVVAYDNLSTGIDEFLTEARKSASFSFVQGDVLDEETLARAMNGVDIVFHLAANADVRFGTRHPRKDLEQNTIATYNVLEAMRGNGIQKIVFSSTGSVYGEATVIPTPETCPFPVQTSLYAASKLAGEGLISAFCEGFGFQAWIFRFVSILGERYTHGHVFDFYKCLLENPGELPVLGDGKQRKSYLYIQDCISAIFTALQKARDNVNVFNLGADEYCEVDDSIGWITESLGLSPRRLYAGGDRGWVGDNPFIFLDTNKIRSLGWTPALTIRDAVLRTLTYLEDNRWLLERRSS